MLEIDPAAASLMLRGKRRMTPHEAHQISVILGTPLNEVMRQAGIEVTEDVHRCPIAAFVNEDGAVTTMPPRTHDTVLGPADCPLGTYAVQVRSHASIKDGWLLFVTPAQAPASANADQLCLVATADGKQVLAVVQGFDPTGVAARSLAECLALQAKEADRYDPCMARLIANLDLVAAGKLQQLKRICQVDDEDLADMVRELRSYDPKPGLRFGGEPTQSVTPDIFVVERAQGWAVEINSASLPRLLLNRSYYAELASGGCGDKKAKVWLNECLTSANWLIKTLDQRQRTILKVATEMVRQQEAFFRHGVAHLKPLTLRQIADGIGMHESTVSRVTSNKYLSCARGMFELKYFFTSGIAAADGGDAISAEAVKTAIRALILAEEPKAILSDDTLVDLLKDQGFDLARRTVAKYREAMGIGSSVQRRRQKAIGG